MRLENNAVVVEAAAAGTLLFAGKGAGALPTASAVLADVVQIARSIAHDRAAPKAAVNTLTRARRRQAPGTSSSGIR